MGDIFQYNQFKNPNNNNIYYADHAHNIYTGMEVHTDRFHHYNTPNTHPSSLPDDHVHNKYDGTVMNRKWLIKETETQNNFPVVRSHNVNSATLDMQPNMIDVPYISQHPETAETTAVAAATTTSSNASRADTSTLDGSEGDRLRALAASTIAATALLTLNRPSHISDGKFSYLDLDQTETTDNYGAREMNIIALKDSSFVDHGKPTQVESSNQTLNKLGIKETNIINLTTSHIHYFPVRDKVINGYETTNHGNDVPTFPNTKIKSHYSKQSPNLMNFNIQRHYHSSNFRLFH
jgi:hypothetical protein